MVALCDVGNPESIKDQNFGRPSHCWGSCVWRKLCIKLDHRHRAASGDPVEVMEVVRATGLADLNGKYTMLPSLIASPLILR